MQGGRGRGRSDSVLESCKIFCVLSRNAGNTNFVLAFSALIPYDDSIDMAMSDAADGFVSKGQGKLNMG